MYLSRLQLDTRSREARRDLADPYQMHRTLTRAFASTTDAAPADRFLWRLEPGLTGQRPVVLVQSPRPGEWGVLNDKPSYLVGEVATKAMTWEPWPPAGTKLRFRLFANPTVTRAGRRYGLMAEEAQLQWLERQGARHGFALEAAIVTGNDRLIGRKGDTVIQIQRVSFEGHLTLLETERFRCALEQGIGPAKALGCGLLSVARR